jgi:hypothetical protein
LNGYLFLRGSCDPGCGDRLVGRQCVLFGMIVACRPNDTARANIAAGFIAAG